MVGLYGPHRLNGWPRAQYANLWVCHRLGLGSYRAGSAAGWATREQRLLTHDVFHHDPKAVQDLMAQTFGSFPRSLEPDYMRFRLGRRARHLPDWLLKSVCRKRAGMVMAVTRAAG
jgi:hypothetical protein